MPDLVEPRPARTCGNCGAYFTAPVDPCIYCGRPTDPVTESPT
jgi:uncharacterized OB-fold protein